MKALLTLIFIFCFYHSALAQTDESREQAIIRSIDDFDLPRNYVEVSEEGLPQDHYLQLLNQMSAFRFTLLAETKVRDLFEDFTRDSRARMRSPGGACSYRRAYIQNQLKKLNIVSGKLLIRCPANNGRMRLRDQVSGRYYTYSNFHDANIVAIKTSTGSAFRVMDVQFEDVPVSLHDYLTKIEERQRIRPLKRKGSTTNLCYWTIGTPYLSY